MPALGDVKRLRGRGQARLSVVGRSSIVIGMVRKIRSAGRPVTAIILAGGRGLRMKGNKALLPVPGGTLLSRKVDQLRPHFDEILVSLSAGGRLDAAGVRSVEDEEPGAGPLAGIMAGLKAARNDVCVVVACDIPDIDIALLRRLARAAAAAEVVVPVTKAGQCEPLFAVYSKPVVPKIKVLLGTGTRKIIPLFDRCRTVFVAMGDEGWLRNLNTRRDYHDYLRQFRQ